MDMLFTHFGISGPAALRCSQFVYKEQKNQKTQHISMAIDAFPELNHEQLKQHITSLLSDTPDKIIKNSLHGLIEGATYCSCWNKLESMKIPHHITYQINN